MQCDLFVCLFVCLSVCLFVCLFVCLSVCLFVCVSFCTSEKKAQEHDSQTCPGAIRFDHASITSPRAVNDLSKVERRSYGADL